VHLLINFVVGWPCYAILPEIFDDRLCCLLIAADMADLRLNLAEIDSTLRALQVDFKKINRVLTSPRDPMTDEVRANMMAGYERIDHVLAKGVDLFSPGNSRQLLELNTLVLFGDNRDKRKQHAKHIKLTEKSFYKQNGSGIGDLMDWYQQHVKDSVWKRAAGAYINILSRPQLFIEGNHRTGALVMSYLLARDSRPPFVLSVDNAKAYFEPSTLVKHTKKHSLVMLVRLPKLKKRFATLLEKNSDKRYLTKSG
jgi:prophage maintenance system killer protein